MYLKLYNFFNKSELSKILFCPIFKELYRIGRLDILRYMVKKDQNQMKLMEENSSPESYIKLCHQYYDGKTII